MTPNELRDVENRLWSAADQMWANTGLMPSEYSAPVLGLIFLRYAEQRFAEVEKELNPSGSGRRTITAKTYQSKGVIFLPPTARFSYLLGLPEGGRNSTSRFTGCRATYAKPTLTTKTRTNSRKDLIS